MNIQIGTKNKFEFTSPFDVYNNDAILEVVSISDIAELEANNLKPYELIYKPVSLSVTDMYNDISSNIKIIVLKTNGKYIYIPSNKFSKSSSTVSGVVYNSRTILVKICALPKDEVINASIDDIKLLFSQQLGIIPSIEEVVTSADTLIDSSDHTKYVVDRKVIRNKKGNYKSQVSLLEKIIADKDELISALKCKVCK